MPPNHRRGRSATPDTLRPPAYRIRSPLGAYLRALGAWLLAVAIAFWAYQHVGREIRAEARRAHTTLHPAVFEARVAERLDRFYAGGPPWEDSLRLLGDVTASVPILLIFVLAGLLSLWLHASRCRRGRPSRGGT